MTLYITGEDGVKHAIKKVSQIKAGTGITVAYNGVRTATISRPVDTATYFDEAHKALKNLAYISTLSNVGSEDTGNLWLWTDTCMSWELPGEVPPSTSKERESMSGGITIYDGCPACSNCASQIAIKKRYERLRLMLNDLKDVNLYTTEDKNRRQNYLYQQLLKAPDNCEVPKTNEYGSDSWLSSYRLLLNYMTAVHMWNYVVSQNNSRTIIRSAAEDNTGFYVQTKRSLPSCDGKSTIQCRITIKARDVQDGISVLVARKHTEFKPFEGSGVSESSMYVQETALAKVFTTTFPEGTVAGTYIAEVKVIPFMYVKITAPDGSVIDMDKLDWSVDTGVDKNIEIDGNTYPGKQYTLGDCDISTDVLEAPTLDQYNSSKTYPAKSITGSNYWDVNVTWTLTGALAGEAGERVWEENFVYATVKVREPVDDLLRSTDLIDVVEIPADEE